MDEREALIVAKATLADVAELAAYTLEDLANLDGVDYISSFNVMIKQARHRLRYKACTDLRISEVRTNVPSTSRRR